MKHTLLCSSLACGPWSDAFNPGFIILYIVGPNGVEARIIPRATGNDIVFALDMARFLDLFAGFEGSFLSPPESRWTPVFLVSRACVFVCRCLISLASASSIRFNETRFLTLYASVSFCR